MEFSALIDSFAKRTGIGELLPDANGLISVEFSGHVVCFSELPQVQHLAIYGHVGELPENAGGDLLLPLMRANFLGQLTCGATLSLSPEDNRTIVLHQLIPLTALDEDLFASAVETFVNILMVFHSQVESFPVIADELGKRKTAEKAAAKEGDAAGFMRV